MSLWRIPTYLTALTSTFRREFQSNFCQWSLLGARAVFFSIYEDFIITSLDEVIYFTVLCLTRLSLYYNGFCKALDIRPQSLLSSQAHYCAATRCYAYQATFQNTLCCAAGSFQILTEQSTKNTPLAIRSADDSNLPNSAHLQWSMPQLVCWSSEAHHWENPAPLTIVDTCTFDKDYIRGTGKTLRCCVLHR